MKKISILVVFVLHISIVIRADVCRQNNDLGIVVGFDYIEASKKDSRVRPLASVSNDRREMANFYKSIFGIKSPYILNDKNYAVSGKNAKERKAAFLNTLKRNAALTRKRNPTARVNIALAGHGMHCRDKQGVVRWCLVLPEALPKSIQISNDIIEVTDDVASALVSDEEIYQATDMDSLMIDGCFSTAAIKNLEIKHERDKKAGFFAFASTPAHLLSPNYDASLGSGNGHLVSLLKGLTEAKGEDLCHMDLDNDGTLSEREVALAFQIHGLSRRLGVSSLSALPENIADQTAESSIGVSNPLVGAVASRQCLMKIPSNTQCLNKKIEDDQYDRCGTQLKKVSAVNKNLEDLFADTSKLNFLSPKGRSLQEISTNESEGRQLLFSESSKQSTAPTDWKKMANDPKRSSAVDYMLEWSKDNREMVGLFCDSEEPIDCGEHDRFDEKIRELQKALLKYAF